MCVSAPGNSQFPHHPAWLDLTVVFRISSLLLSQKPPAPWQQLWTCKPGGGFYYRIWSWIFTRLMSTMEVKISVLFLGFILCWGSVPSTWGQVFPMHVTTRIQGEGHHTGQGHGACTADGPSMAVPGTCFSSEFALDFSLSSCAACTQEHPGAMLLLLWACVHPRADSGQLAWLTSCNRNT